MTMLPKPLGSRLGPFVVVILIAAVVLSIAIFVFHWTWWSAVLAMVGVLVLAGIDFKRNEAWQRRHPELRKRPPPD
jgi:hypothetical protein